MQTRQYALFSLSDREGAIELAAFLQEQGLALLATARRRHTCAAAASKPKPWRILPVRRKSLTGASKPCTPNCTVPCCICEVTQNTVKNSSKAVCAILPCSLSICIRLNTRPHTAAMPRRLSRTSTSAGRRCCALRPKITKASVCFASPRTTQALSRNGKGRAQFA